MTEYEKEMISIEKTKLRLNCVNNDALRIIIMLLLGKNCGVNSVFPLSHQMIGEIDSITAETLAIYFVSETKKILDIDDYVTVCVYESEKSFAEADSDDII